MNPLLAQDATSIDFQPPTFSSSQYDQTEQRRWWTWPFRPIQRSRRLHQQIHVHPPYRRIEH